MAESGALGLAAWDLAAIFPGLVKRRSHPRSYSPLRLAIVGVGALLVVGAVVKILSD